MSEFRPQPASTTWLLIGLVSAFLLLTGTIMPRPLSAVLLTVAVVAYFRSGTRRVADGER